MFVFMVYLCGFRLAAKCCAEPETKGLPGIDGKV